MARETITVEEVAADPTNAYQVTVHGDKAIASLRIIDNWTKIEYANGGSEAGCPKHWHSYVRITPDAPARRRPVCKVTYGHIAGYGFSGRGYAIWDSTTGALLTPGETVFADAHKAWAAYRRDTRKGQ